MERASNSPRTVEITIISCEGLPVKSSKDTSVVVQTDRVASEDVEVSRTRIGSGGSGSHPYWNEKLALPLPDRARFIVIQVQSYPKAKNPRSGRVKTVGAARIPLLDFTGGGQAPENYLRLLSYRLRDAAGEPAGIINVSVRIIKAGNAAAAAATSPPLGGNNYNYLSTGYGSRGVVTGVPVVLHGYPVRHLNPKDSIF